MGRRLFPLLLGVAFLFGGGGVAYADNDQTAVIGFGLGIHSFSQGDDFRDASGPFSIELDVAGMSQLYAEWYALGNLGFGVSRTAAATLHRSSTRMRAFPSSSVA